MADEIAPICICGQAAGYAILTALVALATLQSARHLPHRPGEPE